MLKTGVSRAKRRIWYVDRGVCGIAYVNVWCIVKTSVVAVIETNVMGTYNMLEAARAYWLRSGQPDAFRFHHVSTDEVYGSIDVGSWTEDEPLLPNSPYSAAKAAAEMLVRAYNVTYGLNVSSTRCSNNYGPYQFPEKVIPLFVTNLIDGAKVPLYGDGLNVRDWLHVDDHCRGVAITVGSR